jgi:hypothetical protein
LGTAAILEKLESKHVWENGDISFIQGVAESKVLFVSSHDEPSILSGTNTHEMRNSFNKIVFYKASFSTSESTTNSQR